MNILNRSSIISLSFAIFLLTIIEAHAQTKTIVRPGFRFADNVETTQVSGTEGQAISTPTYATKYAVYGLAWSERSDRPCSLTALVEHIFDSEQHYVEQEVHRCGSKGPKQSSMKEMDFLKIPGQGAVHFANSIEVCMNRALTRVKGFRMIGVRLNETTGTLDPIQGVDPNIRKWRSNCREENRRKVFEDAAVCPSGSVAVAIVGHFDDSEPPRSLTGVALKCQFLEFTDSNGTRPARS